MVKVSVLVPVYNVEKYLVQCLNSVLGQTLNEIEVICINDGSTDNSGSILDDFASKDIRLKVIHKKNTGYGDSMNRGLELARGEYIGIVESDDFIEKNMYERLYSVAQKNELDFVKANHYAYEKGNKIYRNDFDKCIYNEIINNTESTEKFNNTRMAIWTGLYKTSFLRNNNIKFLPTPGASYQDISFSFKIYVAANKGYFLNEAYVNYRIDNENSSVKSKGKVFCVCDEINECKKFLEHRDDKDFFMPYLLRVMYNIYTWNLSRISTEYVTEFVNYVLDDLKSLKQYKGNNNTIFSDYEWENYCYLCECHNKYIEERVINTNNMDIYIDAIIKQFESFKNVYIYGAGKCGKKIENIILRINNTCKIVYVVTKDHYSEENIYQINSDALNKEWPIIISVLNEKDKIEMLTNAQKRGFNNIIVVDSIVVEIFRRFSL